MGKAAVVTAIALVGLGPARAAGQAPSPPATVQSVDLERYAGPWFEIARIPNRFQKDCARNVTARYTLKDDGDITVLNRCTKPDGSGDEAEGVARIVDRESNAKLKVSFVSFAGWRPFWGQYWILEVGEDYEYALVGTADRKYGWILSREPELPTETLERLFSQLADQGYDPAEFILTEQD
jgi:apolipoprotein D and lipocalin family protein